MNRRHFCLQAFALANLANVARRFASAQEAAHDDTEDVYAIWSVLIPVLQPRPGLGYMIADQSAVPDSLPYLYSETEPPKTSVESAKESVDASYATIVPEAFHSSFAQALAEAQKLKDSTTPITRRLELPKQYRLLSESQLKSYFDLTPAVTKAGWKPDEKVAREYKGWNSLSYLSRPYFDHGRQFALIWAGTRSACFDTGWYFFRRNQLQWDHLDWKTAARSECA